MPKPQSTYQQKKREQAQAVLASQHSNQEDDRHSWHTMLTNAVRGGNRQAAEYAAFKLGKSLQQACTDYKLTFPV